MSIDFNDEFKKLKAEYLSSLDDSLEIIRVQRGEGKLKTAQIKEIFRVVHSMKGGAAGHDLPVVGLICHQFESFIESRTEEDYEQTENQETFIRYVDILEGAIEDYQNGNTEGLKKYSDLIADLKAGENFSNESFTKTYKGRVLIAENTSTMGNVIKKELTDIGYECVVTKSGLEAYNYLVKRKFDVLISGITLDDIDGISLLTAVKATSNQSSSIPSIVISSSTNINERFPAAYRPGYTIKKSMNLMDELKATLGKIDDGQDSEIATEENGPKKILYVEDDPRMQKLFDLSIKKIEGVQVEFAIDKEEAIKKCNEFSPDLLLLDNFLKKSTGSEVFLELLDKKIPSIFLTATEGSVDSATLRKHKEFLGIITKPFRPGAIYGQICRFYRNRPN